MGFGTAMPGPRTGGDRRRIAALLLQHQFAGGIGLQAGRASAAPDRDHDDPTVRV